MARLVGRNHVLERNVRTAELELSVQAVAPVVSIHLVVLEVKIDIGTFTRADGFLAKRLDVPLAIELLCWASNHYRLWSLVQHLWLLNLHLALLVFFLLLAGHGCVGNQQQGSNQGYDSQFLHLYRESLF